MWFACLGSSVQGFEGLGLMVRGIRQTGFGCRV